MIRRRGDMFESLEEADILLITTNSYVRNDGSLVMGAGAAKQLRDHTSGAAARLGTRVVVGAGHLGIYGLLLAPGLRHGRDATLGIFQVKTHWQDDARLELIGASALQLLKWTCKNPESTVFLNYPGIGNGSLDIERVSPVVEELPDTVHVWTYH